MHASMKFSTSATRKTQKNIFATGFMVWKRRHQKYRAVESTANTTASRTTARRICNNGDGFNGLIRTERAGAAAAPDPARASNFASRNYTHDSAWGGGATSRVTVFNNWAATSGRAYTHAGSDFQLEITDNPLGGEEFRSNLKARQTWVAAWPEALSGMNQVLAGGYLGQKAEYLG